jgi:lauroyl/myristoyl acyltransferase
VTPQMENLGCENVRRKIGAEFVRSLRKALTFAALRLAMRAAQQSKDGRVMEAIRHGLLGLTRTVIPLRWRLAKNMKQAGVYRHGLLDAHFERAVDQLCMIGHVVRAGASGSGCLERFQFDHTFRNVEQALATGKGLIHIAPHICGFPLYAMVVSSRIPCSVYSRRNTDPRKRRINEEVARAGDGEIVIPPEGASKAQRLNVAISVLRQGKMLFVTPDTPRKPHQGVPVTILGRRAYFPAGVFIMAARTGAPVVPVFWHWEDGTYHIRYSEPMEIARKGRIGEQTEAATKAWADSVDIFLRKHPAMWWNWLDKRWTSILRNNRD